MSADNCPFAFRGSDIGIDEIRKDRHVSFLIPLDHDDPDGLKSKEEIKKLSLTEPGEVFMVILMFKGKVDDLTVPKGHLKFPLFEIILNNHVRREERTMKQYYENQGT